MSKILFICEGPSEKYLVEDVFRKYFANKGLVIDISTVLLGETGGDVTYERLKNDLSCIMQDNPESFVTTVFDYYGLRGNWPGMPVSEEISSGEKVAFLELALKNDLKTALPDLSIEEKFIPNYIMHEYEGLFFTNPIAITSITRADHSVTAILQTISEDYNNCPEDINTHSPPSKRLITAGANYGKIAHSRRIMEKITIDAVRASCPHFNSWLQKLERLT